MNKSSQRKRRRGFHVGRYGEILSVLIKYGYGDLVSALNIQGYLSITRRIFGRKPKSSIVKKTTRWERIRMALVDLGPTFIKFGQFLSNRPDLVPGELIAELECLQDAVPPISAAEARKVLKEEFSWPMPAIADQLDKPPIASASIAQVHKVKLESGDLVALKIQRPHIRRRIAMDVDILYNLAELFESRFEGARHLQLSRLVSEFDRTIEKELDFALEASHIERFRVNFKDDDSVFVPKVYRELSGRRILATEYVDGVKASDIEGITKLGIETKDVAARGADLILKQVFSHGFFHADPHPGNILIRPDGRICFLDFGAIGIIPPTLKQCIATILHGFATKDPRRIVRTLTQLAWDRVEDVDGLEYDVTEFVEEFTLSSLADINVGQVLRRFSQIVMKHGLRIMPGFYLLLKALITVEGVGRRLDPDFKLAGYIEPHVKALLRENARLGMFNSNAYMALLDVANAARELPFEVRDTIRMLRSGDLRIQFEHRGLGPMLQKHDQLVNRVSFAIVLAALIIGSSIVVHSGVPPFFHGIPQIGIIGFVIATLIGFGLLFSILHRRRM